MTRDRMQINAILLVGDHNWRKGPFWPAAFAWLFGRRETIRTHLGDTARVSWWREKPYLVRLRRGA